MKRNQLKIGLLTACLASLSSIAEAQNCGSHSHAKPCKCQQSCQHCDDVGLMRIINDAASSLEDRLARMLPETSSDCDKPSCGCAQCQSATTLEFIPTAPPLIHHTESHPPIPRPMPAIEPAPKPHGPNVRTPELVPEPLNSEDPFKDETARRSRPLPARPIGYQRPKTTPGQSLDPQASSTSTRETNHSVQVATKPHNLAMQSSSRKSSALANANSRPAPDPSLTNDSVVTAAAARVVTKPRVVTPPSEHTVAPAHYNPLRD